MIVDIYWYYSTYLLNHQEENTNNNSDIFSINNDGIVYFSMKNREISNNYSKLVTKKINLTEPLHWLIFCFL